MQEPHPVDILVLLLAALCDVAHNIAVSICTLLHSQMTVEKI